jgi:uncharacterized membrane protein YqgA involved in biofilm formation
MPAVIVNTLAIIAGALIGLFFRRIISRTVSDAVLRMLGICTVVIGLRYALEAEDILPVIVAVCLGTAIGEALRLEERVNSGTESLMRRFTGREGGAAAFASAFVTSCLIMNVGAMVIVGSLQAGLSADYDMLYTKSLLDFTSGIMLAASMGAGVLGSALFTLIFQGAIVLFSESIAPYMTDEVLDIISQTGAILIIAIGLNMLNLTKLRVISALPALVAAPFVLWAASLV